ncbi:MAG TPA: hypothetical protein VEV39_10735 [Gemmatimonadales bacterium]|nr:hypothetical protein [Gemmatimonadales bacterium]
MRSLALLLAVLPVSLSAQVPASLFGGLHWRSIGPFRGGRTVGATGVPGHPNTFFIGVNNGGVWKTDDAGRTWMPVFDAESTGSIGAVAVAPSDPNTIYVGSGEGLQRPDLSVGDGIYKSTDGGATWTHLGLRDGQQIPAVIVDPHDPNRVFAAVLGHPYGPNTERGVFRSTDGGTTWEKVLYTDENTGAFDVAFDASNPQVVFATLWAGRQAPWEIGGSFVLSANNGLYKSTDGGTTWRQITAGLPGAAQGLGRIGLGISPSEPARMYAVVGADSGGALYRSDDDGEHWHVQDADPRIWGRDGDFNEVKVNPRNADIVYIANVVTWKSTDGGVSFTGWRGAPGGDDYHRLWINPDDPNTILLAGDQGAIITRNDGRTWSSWFNQPTAQFYHVSTDNAFPYRVYGGQQESGSAGIWSRGNDGEINFRDWHPVGAEEYGYVAPDPLNPNLVYGGKISRYDWRTGQVQDVSPEPIRSGKYRWVRTMPVLFSPVDPHTLYLGSNVVFKTRDGGEHWQVISPDLTRTASDTPSVIRAFMSQDPQHGGHRGVIYTIAPSFKKLALLWAGTDDGLIWVTHDGGLHWSKVTPPALTPWSKVSVMEASHTDTAEAYAAVNRFRLDDLHPHIYRTRDGGKTWTEIVSGIPDDEVVNAVHEDPVKKGLLFAGTERSVYVSFDDGDHWQSLRLDLPATAVRDLTIHENDLVVGTHGRGFWILDDMSRLRELASGLAGSTHLFRPAPAYRVRWNNNTDTPIPPDEPAGDNPPDGAIIEYALAADANHVAIEVRDTSGALVRRFTSEDTTSVDTSVNIPLYWIRPPQKVGTAAGAHRFVWDLHGAPIAVLNRDYPIAAVIHNTPLEPRGPWVTPGKYSITLTAGSSTAHASLVVKMDPRVPVTIATLKHQYGLASTLANGLERSYDALSHVRGIRRQLAALRSNPAADSLKAAIDSVDGRLDKLESGGRSSLEGLNGELAGVYGVIEGADAAPTDQVERAVVSLQVDLETSLNLAKSFTDALIPALNQRLKGAGLPAISLSVRAPAPEGVGNGEGDDEP